MPEYQGIYFDGKFPEPHLARISMGPGALQITYITQNNTLPVTVYWQFHRIEKEPYTQVGKTVLRYGKYPTQSLEVASPDFWTALEINYKVAPLEYQNSPVQVTHRVEWGWLILIFIGALIPLTYFWVLPNAADLAARQIPSNYEYQLGQTLAAQVISNNIESSQTTYLRGFVRQLQLPMPYTLTFTVIREAEPNAFAIPGGNIVVHQGIFKLISSPEELVALLGHEYGHLKLRHSLRSFFRSLSGYIFISTIIGDISALTAVVIENANAFKSLEYSRDFEYEADKLGLQIMETHCLNPRGMVQLFRHLQAKSPGQDQNLPFISTHPALPARIRQIQGQLKAGIKYPPPNDSLQYYWQCLKNAPN